MSDNHERKSNIGNSTYLMFSDGSFPNFEELLQRANFLPQLPDQRVGVGVVDGHGVDNFLGPLDVPVRPENIPYRDDLDGVGA